MMCADGLVKLIEECAELSQAAAKKMACFWTDKHWDGGPPLSQRLEEEIGDVLAAIYFVTEKFGLSRDRIEARARMKLALYEKWDADPDNNGMSVDWLRPHGERAA